MRTAVFINSNSRQARKNMGQVKADLSSPDSPFEIVSFIVVKRLRKLQWYLDKLKQQENLDCVIIGSGDGTLSAVLQAMRYQKGITFGFLPFGTGNDFMLSLGLPIEYKEAVETLKLMHTRSATLGEINGKAFANIAAVGISVRMAENISDTTKRILGQSAYALSGLRELARHKAFKCTLEETNGITTTFTTHHIIIANGRYRAHRSIGQEASVFKDQLAVVVIGTHDSRWQYAKSIIRFGTGRHHSDPETRIIPITEATLTTMPLRKIEVDGEVEGYTPAKLKVLPNAITVIAGK